jgi:hypothetical protein
MPVDSSISYDAPPEPDAQELSAESPIPGQLASGIGAGAQKFGQGTMTSAASANASAPGSHQPDIFDKLYGSSPLQKQAAPNFAPAINVMPATAIGQPMQQMSDRRAKTEIRSGERDVRELLAVLARGTR